MARRDRLGFTAVRTEGALLPPAILERIHREDTTLGGLKPDDFGLSGEKVREAASRAWNALQAPWRAFQAERSKLGPTEAATSMTRNRWLYPLLRALDYGQLDPLKEPFRADEREFPVSHLYGAVPIYLIGCGLDLDKKPHPRPLSEAERGGSGSKMSPHGLVQLLLNASDNHLWGVVSNGLRWRILRDSVSLSRQAMVEFDLEAIFDGQLYDEFLLLYLLCHQSRLKFDKPEESWLEKWSLVAGEAGKRALDTLRVGVQKAIETLGQDFLKHPANHALRQRVRDGVLDKQDYYRQLLRLVYRLLFFFAAEDRDLLLHPEASDESRRAYREFYSTQRLRLLAERLRGSHRHFDQYVLLRLVFSAVGASEGCPDLGLPALGGFLFRDSTCPDLETAEIANAGLLEAVRCLAVTQDGGRRSRVNFKDLDTVEFGSVYESLLELHPDLSSDGAKFALVSAGGSERKTTGSHYTPDSLVQCLLDSALDPVLNEAAKKPDAEKAILDLKICDPACGSGHFLIGAAHRIARRLAQVRSGEEEPPPDNTRRALRDVVGRCLYGVDINPMAVELCKVVLWMEAIEPGRPLSFLDHHIQCGNSLLGTTPALLRDGIPEAAFTPIEGDDKDYCNEWKRRHKKEHEQRHQVSLTFDVWNAATSYGAAVARLQNANDNSLPDVVAIESEYHTATHSADYDHSRLWADAWCAAFMWQKRPDSGLPYPVTEQTFRVLATAPDEVAIAIRAEIQYLANQFHFFHWHLAFPEVFRLPVEGHVATNPQMGWSGGFDVMLGNPPWEEIRPEEKKFFSALRNDIARVENRAVRQTAIAELRSSDPSIWRRWQDYRRTVLAATSFIHQSTHYPLSARGNLSTSTLFVELCKQLLGLNGSVGLVVPSGLATNEGTSELFSDLMSKALLRSMYDFENRDGFFPEIDSRMRFSLVTLSNSKGVMDGPTFGFFLVHTSDLRDTTRIFALTVEDMVRMNPNSKTCPVFRSNQTARIVSDVHTRHPILSPERGPVSWVVSTSSMFQMSHEANLLYEELDPNGSRSPLYEGKMVAQYNHRASSIVLNLQNEARQAQSASSTKAQLMDPDYAPNPHYWVEHTEIVRKLPANWAWRWLIHFCAVTSPTNERTCLTCVTPLYGAGHSLFQVYPVATTLECLCLIANLNSFALDFVLRAKMGGINLSHFIFKQIPVIAKSRYSEATAWSQLTTITHWIAPYVLELTYAASDLEPFARDMGFYGPPLGWDEERRFLICSELDAAYFLLYGIERTDVNYIMETFPIVKRKDEAAHGEYRTKRAILEIYDAMEVATATGVPYQTRLDPPPANGWTPPEHLVRQAFAPTGPIEISTMATKPKRRVTDDDIEPAILTYLIARERDMELIEGMRHNPIRLRQYRPEIRTLHRIRLAKEAYGVQEVTGVPIGARHERQKWGPLSTTFDKAIGHAIASGWLVERKEPGTLATSYGLGPNVRDAIEKALEVIGDREQAVDDLLFYLDGDRTIEAERQMTIHKSWSDLRRQGMVATVDEVIADVLDWKPNRPGFTPFDIRIAFQDLKERGLLNEALIRPSPTIIEPGPDDLILVPPPSAPTLDLGPGEVSYDLSARVRVNGKLGVLLSETPAGDGKTLIMVQYDGETKPRKFYAPPAVVERLA